MDTSTVVTQATGFLANRSDAMVILVLFIVFFGWWMYKVHIPRQESERKLRESDKEIHQTNAATLSELCKVTTGVHRHSINQTSTLHALVDIKELEIDCIGEISKTTNTNIGDKLAEARGLIRAVRAGVTTSE